MLYVPVTDLTQTLHIIDDMDIDIQDGYVSIISICISKRTGIGLSHRVSSTIVDMPSFKQSKNDIVTSVYEGDDQVFVISDTRDLDMIPDRTSIKMVESDKSNFDGKMHRASQVMDKEYASDYDGDDDAVKSDILK
jgi:hypothetical protein